MLTKRNLYLINYSFQNEDCISVHKNLFRILIESKIKETPHSLILNIIRPQYNRRGRALPNLPQDFIGSS